MRTTVNERAYPSESLRRAMGPVGALHLVRTQFMGIPPTGKHTTVAWINITRFDKGKMVESWTNFDAPGLLQQLGVVPTPGQATR